MRATRELANATLAEMSANFEALCSRAGRPRIHAGVGAWSWAQTSTGGPPAVKACSIWSNIGRASLSKAAPTFCSRRSVLVRRHGRRLYRPAQDELFEVRPFRAVCRRRDGRRAHADRSDPHDVSSDDDHTGWKLVKSCIDGDVGRGASRVIWRERRREKLPLDLTESGAQLSGHGLQLSLRNALCGGGMEGIRAIGDTGTAKSPDAGAKRGRSCTRC